MANIIRPLGIFERFFAVIQNLRFYHNVAFTIRYQWDELRNHEKNDS
ncbi:1334_t:CDS:1, partial [Diversispora eburnea]